jgi:hypothetical protein
MSQLRRRRQFGKCTTCLRLHQSNDDGCCTQTRWSEVLVSGSGHVPASDSVVDNRDTTDMMHMPISESVTLNGDVILSRLIQGRQKILKRLPRASRAIAAEKLASLLAAVIDDSTNLVAWSNLLLCAPMCFSAPGDRGGKKRQSSLTSKVNSVLKEYPNVKSEPATVVAFRGQRKQRSAVNVLSARVSAKIEDGDIRGAIRLAASDDTTAPHNEATLAALRLQHPSRLSSNIDAAASVCDPLPASLVVYEADITEAVKSFPNGSAGGLDQLRPQHLKEMTSALTGEVGSWLTAELTRFVNLCLAGAVPSEMRPI